MRWLLALLTALPCAHPELDTVGPGRGPALCAFLAQPPPSASPLSRTELEGLYRQAGFERARERNSGDLAALVKTALAWVERLFESSSAASYSGATRVLVLLLGALTCLFFLARAGTRVARARTQGVPAAAAPVTAGTAPLAHIAVARGRLTDAPREALREGLLALLSWLEQEGLARPQRVKTNRELAAELPRRGAPAEVTQPLERLLRRYDEAFYSLGSISTDDAARFLDELERLVATKPMGSR